MQQLMAARARWIYRGECMYMYAKAEQRILCKTEKLPSALRLPALLGINLLAQVGVFKYLSSTGRSSHTWDIPISKHYPNASDDTPFHPARELEPLTNEEKRKKNRINEHFLSETELELAPVSVHNKGEKRKSIFCGGKSIVLCVAALWMMPRVRIM